MADGEPEKKRLLWGTIRLIFWPLGGTVLGLLVFPVAIEQYPEIFKESKWILPVGVSIVSICWILPLLFHHRLRNIHTWAIRLFGKKIGWPVIIQTWIVAAALIVLGWKNLYKRHSDHLESRLKSPDAPTKGPDSPSPKTPTVLEPPDVAKTPRDKKPKIITPKFIYKGWDPFPASGDEPASVQLHFFVTGEDGTVRYVSRAWSASGGPTDPKHPEQEIKMQDSFWAKFEQRSKADKSHLIAATRGNSTQSLTLSLGPELSAALPALKEEGGIIFIGTTFTAIDGVLIGQTCLVINVASNNAHLCSNHNFP